MFRIQIMLLFLLTHINTFATTYFDKGEFLSKAFSVPYLMMESFEQLPVDNAPGVVEEDSMPCIYPTIELPDFLLVAESETLSVADLERVAGMHAIDGKQYVIHYYGTKETYTHQLDVYFEIPTRVFGLTITDWGDADIGTLSFMTNTGEQGIIAEGAYSSDNDIFFGIIAGQEFDQFTITHNNIHDSYSIDEVYYTVPEPTVAVLLLAGAGFLRKRQGVCN